MPTALMSMPTTTSHGGGVNPTEAPGDEGGPIGSSSNGAAASYGVVPPYTRVLRGSEEAPGIRCLDTTSYPADSSTTAVSDPENAQQSAPPFFVATTTTTTTITSTTTTCRTAEKTKKPRAASDALPGTWWAAGLPKWVHVVRRRMLTKEDWLHVHAASGLVRGRYCTTALYYVQCDTFCTYKQIYSITGTVIHYAYTTPFRNISSSSFSLLVLSQNGPHTSR